jgi:hypothetical protein
MAKDDAKGGDPQTHSHSQSRSTPHTSKDKESSIPSVSILVILQSMVQDVTKGLPTDTFAQVAARPPSPNPTIPTTSEKLIASATSKLSYAIKKHQNNFLALLRSVSLGKSVSVSKTKRLKNDNLVLMSSATIRVQHAGGTHFSIKCLYKLARSKEKEATRLFNKDPLPNSLSIDTKAKETATTMSSIMDSDGFTTVSCLGGSSTSSPLSFVPKAAPPLAKEMRMEVEEIPLTTNFSPHFSRFFHAALPTSMLQLRLNWILRRMYVNDPDSRQPTKKALCEDQSLLVTAAQSSTSSTYPVQISMYTKKRTALSSPAKGGMTLTSKNPPQGDAQPRTVLPTSRNKTSNARKKAFDNALENKKFQRDVEITARRVMMAPFDKFVKEAEEEDAEKGDARLARIEFLQKKFAEIAHQKGRCKAIDNPISDLLRNNTHSNDTSDNELDNDGIYGRMVDDEDKDFSYHSSDGSAEEDENDQQVLGQNAVGTLPLATN